METDHPIPKNVTDFEFHLVGDMTLKQFGFLAGGLGVAYLLFVILASSAPIVAYPLIIIFALSGTAAAFLPIHERPLDHWVKTFFKAIFQPTQREYRSSFFENINPKNTNRLEVYFSTISDVQNQTEPVVNPSLSQLQTTQLTVQELPGVPQTPQPQNQPETDKKQPAHTMPLPVQQKQSLVQPEAKKDAELPSNQQLKKTVELAKEAQLIQGKILEQEKQINEIKAKAAAPGNNFQQFTEQFQRTMDTLQALSTEAQNISRKLVEASNFTPPPTPRKKIIHNLPGTVNKQVVLTSTPNVINGIVTDSQGNYLEGVIVVTHDKQGLPVRALKSNKLGQFVAATPLPNGTYNLTLEKDDLAFDILEIKLVGNVIQPIAVSAKKGDQIGVI